MAAQSSLKDLIGFTVFLEAGTCKESYGLIKHGVVDNLVHRPAHEGSSPASCTLHAARLRSNLSPPVPEPEPEYWQPESPEPEHRQPECPEPECPVPEHWQPSVSWRHDHPGGSARRACPPPPAMPAVPALQPPLAASPEAASQRPTMVTMAASPGPTPSSVSTGPVPSPSDAAGLSGTRT